MKSITSCSSSLRPVGPPRDTQSYATFWGGYATIPQNCTPALVPLSKALALITMKHALAILFIFLISGCSHIGSAGKFYYFGQCINISDLHPYGADLDAERRKADEFGIDVLIAIRPIVEDVLHRDGNYGLPLGYKTPRHHYHFSVLGNEVDMGPFKASYPDIVRAHSVSDCPESDEDRPSFINYNTINRIYLNSYVFGYQGFGSDGYGIVRYEPNHAWKKWPELVETGINTIYN